MINSTNIAVTKNPEILETQSPQEQTPTPELDWKSIISDWEQSGESQRAYCAAHNIKLHIFTYYRNKLCQLAKKQEKKLAPVMIAKSPSASAIERYLLKRPSGAILSIPTSFEEHNLQSLLSLLGVIS